MPVGLSRKSNVWESNPERIHLSREADRPVDKRCEAIEGGQGQLMIRVITGCAGPRVSEQSSIAVRTSRTCWIIK